MGCQWITPRPCMVARFSVTAPLTTKTLPTEHKFKLIYSDLPNCLSVCIAGCWNDSLLAEGIPYMHVNNITDSNSDSKLFTLQLRAHLVLSLCYLCWWSFLPPTSAFTLLAHVVLHLLLALVVFFYLQLPHLLYYHMWWSHCYLHCVVVVVVVVVVVCGGTVYIFIQWFKFKFKVRKVHVDSTLAQCVCVCVCASWHTMHLSAM